MAEAVDRDALRARIAGALGRPAEVQLTSLLEAAIALGADGIDARQRLSLLEELRLPLWQALRQYEQQALARAMPFSAAELQRWQHYCQGWTALLDAYQRALADAAQDAELLAATAPLLMQRVLRQAVQVAVACYRAYRPVAGEQWRRVHDTLRRAEQDGVAGRAVADATVDPAGQGSVVDAWLQLLLLDFCDPYGLSPAQLALACRWTERLARLVTVARTPVRHGPAGFLVVDLAREEGLRLQPEAPDPELAEAGDPRFLDIGEARAQIKRELARLRLGLAPGGLFVDDQCTRDQATEVLERIYRRWRTSRRRAHPRRPTDQPVRIAAGLAAVQRCLGELQAGVPAAQCTDLGVGRLVDQSADGLGLVQGEGGARLRSQLMVAVLGEREVLLGSVRWLTVEAAVGLRFGVRLMAGQAEPAWVRTSATMAGDREPALLLPAMPALELPATLIVAPGTYFPARELQLGEAGQADRVVRLERLIEAGADFERISWQPAD